MAGTTAGTIRIEVQSLAFNPAQVTAHVGDTIEWNNTDFIPHTVEYFCRFHPNMTGSIAVEGKR